MQSRSAISIDQRYFDINEDEFQQVSVSSSNLHRPANSNRRVRQNTRSGSSADPHNDPTATSMVYLNMSTDGPHPEPMEFDEASEFHLSDSTTMVYANGVNNSTANIEAQFPKQVIHTIEDESEGSHEERFDIQSADAARPRPTVLSDNNRNTQRDEDDVEYGCMPMEHYVDLPADYTLLFIYIGLGILFVTGMLVMVIFTELDVYYVGATTKVLLFIIIIPVVFFLAACGFNLYGCCLGRKLAKEDE